MDCFSPIRDLFLGSFFLSLPCVSQLPKKGGGLPTRGDPFPCKFPTLGLPLLLIPDSPFNKSSIIGIPILAARVPIPFPTCLFVILKGYLYLICEHLEDRKFVL